MREEKRHQKEALEADKEDYEMARQFYNNVVRTNLRMRALAAGLSFYAIQKCSILIRLYEVV